MNKKLVLFFTIITFHCSSIAHNSLSLCRPTTEYKDNYEPEIFPKTNNLLRMPGEMPVYCGEKLILRGKVVDVNCVPVSDARVNIWQVACDGKYPYQPLRSSCKPELINLYSEATFIGAGTAITNNKGEFYFITTYPPSVGKQAPHANIRVSHRHFHEFNTKVFLTKKSAENPPVDFVTPYYSGEGVLVNEFLIVLPTVGVNREF